MKWPTQVVSDNEAIFRMRELKEWAITKGCYKTFISKYNPRANGIDENFNKTLLNMLRPETLMRDWDENVFDLVYHYNLAEHSTTGESPFYCHFLREGKIAPDLYFDCDNEEDFISVKDFRTIGAKRAAESMRLVKDNVRKYHKLKDGNKMRKRKSLGIGDLVAMKVGKFDTIKKTVDRYEGPFEIHRVMGKNVYKIKNEKGIVIKQLVTGRNLIKISKLRKLIKRKKEEKGKKKQDEIEYLDLQDLYIKENEANQIQKEVTIPLEKVTPPPEKPSPKRKKSKRATKSDQIAKKQAEHFLRKKK